MIRLNKIWPCIPAIILGFYGGFATMAEAASNLLSGSYRCSAYNVSGGGGSCRNMPPLELRADGSYQYSSSRGLWSINGGKLLLSEAQTWGLGEIVGSNSVRFEYDYRGWRHTVTWVCQECAATSQGGVNSSNGAYAGVSLTLQFSQQVGGVSGFTIVPAESARNYTHNAPLPVGAVQGGAWELSPTTVGMATNRNNKLMSGRRYVIFLVWPRESIPVAMIELPRTDRDYMVTLPATLDGAAVLGQIHGGSVSIPPPGQFPYETPQEPSPGAYTQPMPSDVPMGYPPPQPADQGGMPPSPQTGSGSLQEFVNNVNELGKAIEGLTRRGKKDRKPVESGGASNSNHPAYQQVQPAYPGPDPSASNPPPSPGYPATGSFVANPSGYPASPPPTYDSGGSVPGYGAGQGGQAATPATLAPKCNPNIPRYSQTGCVE